MRFAEFMERPAGEVVIAFLLVGVGTLLFKAKVPHADEAIGAGLTLIARALVAQAVKGDK